MWTHVDATVRVFHSGGVPLRVRTATLAPVRPPRTGLELARAPTDGMLYQQICGRYGMVTSSNILLLAQSVLHKKQAR